MNTPLNDQPALGSMIQDEAQASPASSDEDGQTSSPRSASSQTSNTPRLVIRGENPVSDSKTSHSDIQPNFAIVDWLNFTFLYSVDIGSNLLTLDQKFKSAFGFGLRANRMRGHLNYTNSWELGDGFGIFAHGGSSVGGTCFFSISSDGCMAVRDWNLVYELLEELKANITRLDLAYDDFAGIHNIRTAQNWYEEGRFHSSHGRNPSIRLIDDFDDGSGKTLYIGKRKNGKLLRIYEKGKQLGDPLSTWVRWELELHNKSYNIPNIALIYPGYYLAGSYPSLSWISETQYRFESVKKSQQISFELLIKSCRNSYGKLIWLMSDVLGIPETEIIQKLSQKGIPSRLNVPVVGGGDAI